MTGKWGFGNLGLVLNWGIIGECGFGNLELGLNWGIIGEGGFGNLIATWSELVNH